MLKTSYGNFFFSWRTDRGVVICKLSSNCHGTYNLLVFWGMGKVH